MRGFFKIAERWATMVMIGLTVGMFWMFVWLVVQVDGIIWAAVVLALAYTWFFVTLAVRLCKQWLKEEESK